jgi:DNA-binding cell septation regulator SpoVG
MNELLKNRLKGQDANLGKILSRSDELEKEVDRIVEGQEMLMAMLPRSNVEHEETRSLISNIEYGIRKEVQKANVLTNTVL